MLKDNEPERDDAAKQDHPAPSVGDMSENAELSELIGGIYDTVLDRSLWPQVLKRASQFIEGAASAVFWADAAGDKGDVYLDDGGIAPHYKELYFSKYAKLNPTSTTRFFAKAEEPVATVDTLPYDEFIKTRFYREWAQPQDLVDFVSVALEKSPTRAAMFGVFRHKRHGLVDEATRRRMRLLAPHIRRAVLIAKVVDLRRAEAATFSEALDGLRAATFLVDANSRIAHANTAGHLLLQDGRILREVEGRLSSRSRRVNESLHGACLAAARGDAAIGRRGIALPLTARTGEWHVAHVLPLTSGERTAVSAAAAAAVFVHKTAIEAASPPEVIAEAYKLTMAELRVLFSIVEVGSVREAAEMLGIAGTTVKTHLAHIYEKTGTARQADLVKLVAGFASPLLP